MADPWFYTRAQLQARTAYVRGIVLDVGAGTQKYRPLIERTVDRYVSLDAFAADVNVRGDIHALPFRDDVFDTVICNQVLEHVPRPWLAVQEMYRILRSDGHLLISAPWMFPYHASPHDYYRYSRHGIQALCESAGFEIIEVAPMGSALHACSEALKIALGGSDARTGTIARHPMIERMMSVVDRCIGSLTRPAMHAVNAPNHFTIARKPSSANSHAHRSPLR